MLDIARGIYTLHTDKIIAKTDDADWALKNNLCSDPDVLRITLRVHRSPLERKISRPLTTQKFAESIQRFADVLKNESKTIKEIQ